MLTLFHAPRSRSSRFLWLLEELQVPYTVTLVNIRRGDGSGALDQSNPHPHGKVPVIVHEGVAVYESPAIALYLTDAYPQNAIGPKIGEPARGPYLSWLAYYGDVMEPAFMSKFLNTSVPRGTAGWVVIEEAMEHVLKTLSSNEFLLGERFSAADVLYGSTFALFRGSPVLPPSPVLDAYVRASARDNG
jgi:glutathione S-transferase